MKTAFLITLMCISFASITVKAADDDEDDSGSQAQTQSHQSAEAPPPPPPPPSEHKGPPPREAIDACASKSMNSACSFNDREGESKTGECWQPDSSKPLACRPK